MIFPHSLLITSGGSVFYSPVIDLGTCKTKLNAYRECGQRPLSEQYSVCNTWSGEILTGRPQPRGLRRPPSHVISS